MKGNNELRFNEATMCEILEYYLTNDLFGVNVNAKQVTKVEQETNGWFTVAIAEKEEH